MIPATCHTNLDDYKGEKWPDQFVAVPQIGNRVEAESGKVLRVVGVTHRMRPARIGEAGGPKPEIRVELHGRVT